MQEKWRNTGLNVCLYLPDIQEPYNFKMISAVPVYMGVPPGLFVNMSCLVHVSLSFWLILISSRLFVFCL